MPYRVVVDERPLEECPSMDRAGVVEMDGNAQSMGITASTGVILELNDFQLGMMVGVDRATGDAGRGWVYNGKIWYAFGLGYSFLKNSPR